MNITKILALSLLISVAALFSYSHETKPNLYIFSAKWCGTCKVAEKDMQADNDLKEMLQKYEVVKFNSDTDKEFVKKYNIKSIPVFIILEDGKEVSRQVGYKNAKDLIRFLK